MPVQGLNADLQDATEELVVEPLDALLMELELELEPRPPLFILFPPPPPLLLVDAPEPPLVSRPPEPAMFLFPMGGTGGAEC
jgi:hypothetical protein